MHPLTQLPGINKDLAARLVQGAKSRKDGTESLFALRRLPRDDAANLLKRVSKGKGPPLRPMLDFLFSTPLISVENLQILHKVDKTSGVTRGNLKVSLEIQRGSFKSGGKDSGSFSLCVALGSSQRRTLLAHTIVQISRTGKWTQNIDLDFDWDAANADGGDGSGSMILRLILEQIRGLDAEVVVPIV